MFHRRPNQDHTYLQSRFAMVIDRVMMDSLPQLLVGFSDGYFKYHIWGFLFNRYRMLWKPFWVYLPSIVCILCNPISSFLVYREQKVCAERPVTKYRKKSDFLTLKTLQTVYICHDLDFWNKIFSFVALKWLRVSFEQLVGPDSGLRTYLQGVGVKKVAIRMCLKCFQKFKSHIDIGH